jgi:hypothetical protein
MTTENNPESKTFPGSPTGNQSRAGGSRDRVPGKSEGHKAPIESYPGSSTGNASGMGDAPGVEDKP